MLVCRQHCTGVLNLNRHLQEQHKTPVQQRQEVVQYFNQFSTAEPSTIQLPRQPAKAIQERGAPLDGLRCTACSYITVSSDEMRKHCKKTHELPWIGDKSSLFTLVKVQTFFNSRGLRKYFVVDVDAEIGRGSGQQQSVDKQQLNNYKQVRKQLEDAEQVVGETAKTDKTL